MRGNVGLRRLESTLLEQQFHLLVVDLRAQCYRQQPGEQVLVVGGTASGRRGAPSASMMASASAAGGLGIGDAGPFGRIGNVGDLAARTVSITDGSPVSCASTATRTPGSACSRLSRSSSRSEGRAGGRRRLRGGGHGVEYRGGQASRAVVCLLIARI